MRSLKKNVEQMIRSLPDDSAVEDIQYHLYVLDKIQKGRTASVMVKVSLTKKPNPGYPNGSQINLIEDLF